MEGVADLSQAEAMPAFWDTVMDDMDKGLRFTEDEVVHCYDTWAKDGSYEKSVGQHGYGALDVLEKTMEKLFPGDKDTAVLLDVGACTGLTGQRLYKMGFRHIDGLDPSSESLKIADQKSVYRTLFNVHMTAEPLNIPQNSYDAVIVVGATGPKHLPLEAFTEMIRLVKPGGYILNLMRAEYLDKCQDYICKWNPIVETHTTAGKWRLLEEECYEHHFHDRAGYKHVFQVR